MKDNWLNEMISAGVDDGVSGDVDFADIRSRSGKTIPFRASSDRFRRNGFLLAASILVLAVGVPSGFLTSRHITRIQAEKALVEDFVEALISPNIFYEDPVDGELWFSEIIVDLDFFSPET